MMFFYLCLCKDPSSEQQTEQKLVIGNLLYRILYLSPSYFDCFAQYDDDEGDRVLLATDSDLIAAIEHARSAGWKVDCSLLL